MAFATLHRLSSPFLRRAFFASRHVWQENFPLVSPGPPHKGQSPAALRFARRLPWLFAIDARDALQCVFPGAGCFPQCGQSPACKRTATIAFLCFRSALRFASLIGKRRLPLQSDCEPPDTGWAGDEPCLRRAFIERHCKVVRMACWRIRDDAPAGGVIV